MMDNYTVHPKGDKGGPTGFEVRKNNRDIRPGVSECDESWDFGADEEVEADAFADRMNKGATDGAVEGE